MWIRVGAFKVKAGAVDDLRATYNEVAVPRVRAFAGNLGCLLLEPVAGNDDEFLVITIWNGRAAADAYEGSGAAAEVVNLVRPFFAGPPALRTYESGSLAGLALGGSAR
jgi:quinol monooxygenase YgiN